MIIVEDISEIDRNNIPRHIACVMDGNGRWATSQGLSRTEGHVAGEEALLPLVDVALELGIEWLTVFAFSTENWSRPHDEIEFLMQLSEKLFNRRDEFHRKGVRLRRIGRSRDLSPAPSSIFDKIDEAVELTKDNTDMNVVFAFDYGSQDELVNCVRSIVTERLSPHKIDEETIATHLYEPEMPPVDLLIRTSGEQRISNFLLWQLAYSEIVFTDTLWPDFGPLHLASAIKVYQQRKRRKGRARSLDAEK